MPYNNAPIAPPEEVTGSSQLPLARVKKIISQDEDIAQCSNSAAFAMSVATEIFLRYLTESAYNVVKTETTRGKPRRNIAYKDIATAVSRIDNLEFLSDVVPKTKTYRQFKEEKAREDANAKARPASSNGVDVNGEGAGGNRSIQAMMQQPPQTNGLSDGNGEMEMINGHGHGHISVPHSPMADRTVGHGHPDPVRDLASDVDMTG
jgi:DNA-directed RNA polymerase I subunit RPA43